jgi:hypothetical protein
LRDLKANISTYEYTNVGKDQVVKSNERKAKKPKERRAKKKLNGIIIIIDDKNKNENVECVGTESKWKLDGISWSILTACELL